MFRAVFQRASAATRVSKRFINIHEYQSKELMAKHNVAVQRFRVCEAGATYTPEQAAKDLSEKRKTKGKKKILTFFFVSDLAAGREYVVKAQVHAGGRGKGQFKETGFKGGVHVVNSVDSAAKITREMLGKHVRQIYFVFFFFFFFFFLLTPH
jgi:succinyl-CoA synthetase beta subunit